MLVLSLKRTIALSIGMLLLTVGPTGCLAFFNGRRTVNNLTQTLVRKAALHVEDSLGARLEEAQTVNRINAEALLREANDPLGDRNFEQQVWAQIQVFTGLDYIYAGNKQGEFVGAARSASGPPTLGLAGPASGNQFQTYTTTETGERLELIAEIPDYDPRQRPWYQAAIAAGGIAWGPIYVWSAPYPNLVLPAVQPASSELLAVVAADISLQALSDYLSTLQLGRNGQVFILERSGLLVATSTPEKPYSQAFERIEATESSQPLTRATARAIVREYGNFAAITEEGQFTYTWRGRAQVVQVAPFRDKHGLDWLLVAVVPRADFMGTVNSQMQITLALGVLAVAIAGGLGFLATRRALQPLVRLNAVAAALKAQQPFEPRAIDDLTRRSDEVGEFARVFQTMAAAISEREQSLDEQLQALSTQLDRAQWRDRNAELARLRPYQQQAAAARQVTHLTVGVDTLLKRSPYFGSFSSSELQQLIVQGYQRGYEPGETICREGDPGTEFYVILAGRVEIFTESLDKHLNTFTTGSAFGEVSLLMGIPRTATAVARDYTTLFILSRSSLSEMLQQYPQLRDRLAQQLYLHQAELRERQEILRRHNLIDDDFYHHLLQWIQRRLRTLFGGESNH